MVRVLLNLWLSLFLLTHNDKVRYIALNLRMDEIKVRVKPISQTEWCFIMIFPTEQESETLQKELVNIETYFYLAEQSVTVVINLLNKGQTITFKNLKITPSQKVQIDNKTVTHISCCHSETDLLNDNRCQYANVKYRED